MYNRYVKGAWVRCLVQENKGQPGGFNQPSTAADAYASGGQNYYAAGWQAAQVARPQTAGSARAPSFVPELWGARQGEASSTAHAQLTPADGQVSMRAFMYCLPFNPLAASTSSLKGCFRGCCFPYDLSGVTGRSGVVQHRCFQSLTFNAANSTMSIASVV